jgi:Putative transposase/Transposase zinc-binding domain
MQAIEGCRTALLGGHVDQCDHCGHLRISYNSCRNRHCPKCQFLRKEQWIQARREDLLPIPYFHVVFTVPAELNPLFLRNRRVLYELFFLSVSETLRQLAQDPRRLGARIGFMGIVHTWGQNLMDHPHIHCIVTGGGLSLTKDRWISCRKGFFLPVKVISKLFRNKFLDYLKKSYGSGKLAFFESMAHLKQPKTFQRFLSPLYLKQWVVYCKPPFNGAEGVLNYLSRYTHRVAISNERILKLEGGRVSFRWRDYSDGDKQKIMAVAAEEFIRRFLLHVLPAGFVKIRHYGLLANRNCKNNITLCRTLLGDCTPETQDKNIPETWQEHLLKISGLDVSQCPVCKKGRLFKVEALLPLRCNGPP